MIRSERPLPRTPGTYAVGIGHNALVSEHPTKNTPPAFDLDQPTTESVAMLFESGHPVLADILLRHLEEGGNDQIPPELRLKIMQAREDPIRIRATIRTILARNPNLPALKLALARCCYTLGQLEKSIEHIRSIKIPPHHPKAALVNWWHARILIRAGEFEDAATITRDLSRTPSMKSASEVLLGEIDLLRGDLEPARDRLRAITCDDKSAIPPRFDACFLLARTLDRLGDSDGAFEAAKDGNRIHPNDFDPDAWDRATDAIIDTFDESAVQAATRSTTTDDSPVFLVGMPRSGTSLLEQILASHPRAGGVGERQDPFLIEEDVTAIDDFRKDGASSGDLDLEARLYLEMQEAMGIERDRIVNKALGLDRALGTLARVLPGSRVIHLERNPRDTILSIHQHNINNIKYPWSRELEHICRARAAHERLMDHWKSVLPTPILTVNYESVVADPHPQIERITSFLGIDFDEACLRFHELDRAVITPSHDQVSKPLNSSGIGRWRRYERHLGSVLEAYPVTSNDPDAQAFDQ